MDELALVRFITAALGGRGSTLAFGLGSVSDVNAALVRNAAGLDVKGYTRTISASEVRHIFKSHGNPAREAARGQQVIRKADLANVVGVIDAASAVIVKGEPHGHRPQRLVYTSAMDDCTFECVETLHPARRVLAIKTMRKW